MQKENKENKVIKKEKKQEKKMLEQIGELEHKTNWVKFILEGIVDFVVILFIFFIVRSFLVAPFLVSGHSMDASLHDGEFIVVNKLSYIIGDVERGDVVVFRPPIPGSKDYYIKRIIGLPGETVKLADKKVYICEDKEGEDCYELPELYLNELNAGYTCNVRANCPVINNMKVENMDRPDTTAIYHVPEGGYFVLGDNRTGSSDSRFFVDKGGSPYVPRESLEGKSWIELFYTSDEFKTTSWPDLVKKAIGQMDSESDEPWVNFSKIGFTPDEDYNQE